MSIEDQLLQMIQDTEKIFYSRATWEYKFDRIFAMWKKRHPSVHARERYGVGLVRSRHVIRRGRYGVYPLSG